MFKGYFAMLSSEKVVPKVLLRTLLIFGCNDSETNAV